MIIFKFDHIDKHKLRSSRLGEIIRQGFDFKWLKKISISINDHFFILNDNMIVCVVCTLIDPLKVKPYNDKVNQTVFKYENKHLCGWQYRAKELISERWVRIFEDKTF